MVADSVGIKKKPWMVSLYGNAIWWSLRDANGTLEEWVRKSDGEIAAIEDEIREMRKLLDDGLLD